MWAVLAYNIFSGDRSFLFLTVIFAEDIDNPDRDNYTLFVGYIFLDSSMVEHSAVNRVVVGSSPTRGGKPADIQCLRVLSI